MNTLSTTAYLPRASPDSRSVRPSVSPHPREDAAVGYGASVAGISSLYQFGLEERVDLLVDDAEKRVGMYSPHSNHKVFSSRELKSLDVQTTLILVPRYTDSIIARWSGLLGNVMPVGRV